MNDPGAAEGTSMVGPNLSASKQRGSLHVLSSRGTIVFATASIVVAIALDFFYEWETGMSDGGTWGFVTSQILNNALLITSIVLLILRGRASCIISMAIFAYYLVRHLVPLFN